ncbi:MAG: IclR family transcriptional regulator [Candidatus Dormibacteria bacterium]
MEPRTRDQTTPDTHPPVATGRSRYHTEALARGLAILGQFDESTPWLSLAELSTRTELGKSTALRLVDTLHSLGFLERSLSTRKYRPGLAVLQLGHAALAASSLHDLALPELERLAAKTRETVNMGVLVGGSVLYIARLKRAELVTANIQVGSTLPAYCTSMGKLLLAHLDRERLAQALLQHPMERLGPHTIVAEDELSIELQRIRQQGWSVQDEELAAGLRSVAAPVRDASSQVIAAVNVAVSAARVSVEELTQRFPPLVLNCANAISALAGDRRR